MCCWLASFIRSPSAPPIATQIPRLGPAQIESKGWPNRRAFHRTSRVMAAPTLASVLFAFSISSFPIVLSIRRSSSNHLLRGQRLCRYRRFRTAQVSSPQLRPPALPDARLPFTEAATSLGSSNRQRFLQDHRSDVVALRQTPIGFRIAFRRRGRGSQTPDYQY